MGNNRTRVDHLNTHSHIRWTYLVYNTQHTIKSNWKLFGCHSNQNIVSKKTRCIQQFINSSSICAYNTHTHTRCWTAITALGLLTWPKSYGSINHWFKFAAGNSASKFLTYRLLYLSALDKIIRIYAAIYTKNTSHYSYNYIITL